MKTITITVTRGGKSTIETSGFQGSACVEATKALTQALGGKVTDDTPTPEMYHDQSENLSQA